jgi:hypothetical protein
MNSKQQIFLVSAAISSFLLMVASISGLTTIQVFGQQNNTNVTSTSSNLTQRVATPGPMALTQSDFGELADNLNSAREALRDRDLPGAIGDLGSAETELRVFMTQVGGGDSPNGQLLLMVLNHINIAQDASGNNDTLKAFQEINTADFELLNITQKLPADGDEND